MKSFLLAVWFTLLRPIQLCTNRFDDETKASFVDLFSKISGGDLITEVESEEVGEEIPF
jgi:hypothetical protein